MRQVINSGVCCVFSLALSAGVMGQTYHAARIGDLGGTFSAAFGVNDAGVVVGAADLPDGSIHAVVSVGGVATDLGTLPGGTSSRAFSINSAGVIVGWSRNSIDQVRPVRWDPQGGGGWTIVDLGSLGGAGGMANRVNASGQIVGRANVPSGRYHAFLSTPPSTQLTDLGILSYPQNLGYSESLGINNAGHIVGYAYAPLWGPDHAFYFNGRNSVDIGPTGQFDFSRGYSINNSDLIAGVTILQGGQSTGFEAAVYTAGGGWREIGVIAGQEESEAYDINDGGQVVGMSYTLSTQEFRGFVYSGSGVGLVDLNAVTPDTPGLITDAQDINTDGAIAANVSVDGELVGVLLIPGCPADVNHDNTVTSQDFFDFLGAFFAGDADFNHSGATDSQDFFDFLGAFFVGC